MCQHCGGVSRVLQLAWRRDALASCCLRRARRRAAGAAVALAAARRCGLLLRASRTALMSPQACRARYR